MAQEQCLRVVSDGTRTTNKDMFVILLGPSPPEICGASMMLETRVNGLSQSGNSLGERNAQGGLVHKLHT